ncbi:MAG TPA: sugar ABC transporter permease, partial [Methylomirabilota bacterium]|nr:sugar ABC transporter permease [Methylomirabilota bacterium]
MWAAGGGAPRPAVPLATGALLLAATLVCAWSLGRSRAARRAAVAVLAGLAVVHGWSAGRGVRQAAVWSTDRALLATRSLVQDAPVRMVGPPSRVSLAAVARVVQGTGLTLSLADSGGPGVIRTAGGGAPRAALSARLGPRRWATLHTLPLEETTGAWIALCVGLALLAPVVAAVSGWGAVVLDRPRVLRETATAWTFLAPAALHLAVFSFGPILFALWLALHRWSLIEPVRPFVGLSNFATVASDSLVRVSLRNTVVYALYVPVTTALALAAALALNGPGRLVRWVRTAFFVPYVSSVVAVALVWQWMLNAEFGLFNWVLSAFGVGAVDWLGDRRTALLSVMLVSVWVQLGYQMTVFVAGLQAIPRTYLDAARVDGAGPWQRFWRVTFPLLRPVTLFVLVTGVIGS